MFVAAGSSAAPRLRPSFLASALQEYVGTLASSVSCDIGNKAMLVCSTVGIFLNLLRERCSTRCVIDVLLPKAEEAWQLRFRPSNRAHHIRSAAEILAKLEFERCTDGFSRVRLNALALNGYSGAVRQLVTSSVQCGVALAFAAMASRARQRAFSNFRLGRWSRSALSPPAIDAVHGSLEAHSLVCSWHVDDVLLEVLQASTRSFSSLSSLAPAETPPLSLFRAAAVRCRPWLASLLDCSIHLLALPSLGVVAKRARALFSSLTEVHTLDRLTRAAERSYLFWGAVVPSLSDGKLKAEQVSLIRSFVRKPLEANSRTGENSSNLDFNVLCANIGTSRAQSRVTEVFQLAQDMDASVVFLQETRLATGEQLRGLPPGWTCFVAGRSVSANKGGGVAVAVRQPVLGGSDGRVVDVNPFLEVQWCRFRIDARSNRFIHCASIYVPPTALDSEEKRLAFRAAADGMVSKVKQLVSSGEQVIIGGDFNANLSLLDRSSRQELLRSVVLECGLLVANSMDSNGAPRLSAVSADNLAEVVSRCPATHLQQGEGTDLRAASAPSRLDWILVSPALCGFVTGFELSSWLPSGHAVLSLRARLTNTLERFVVKQRVRLRVDLLSRAHVTEKDKRRLDSLIAEEEKLTRLARAEHSLAARVHDPTLAPVARAETILSHQLASVELQQLRAHNGNLGVGALGPLRSENHAHHFAHSITALLDAKTKQRFAELEQLHQSVAHAQSLDEACTLFSNTLLEIATPLLSGHARQSSLSAPNHAPSFRFEWWTDELQALHKLKKRAACKYGKQLQRNKRDIILTDEVKAKTETRRLALRALERQFSALVVRAKRDAFANLLRRFDSALDFDAAFPLTLWKMLSAMQKKKASPNGTGALIAVDPKQAMDFWSRVWSDDTRADDVAALDIRLADYASYEALRDSFSSYAWSENKRVDDALCAPITAAELHECAISLATGKSPGSDELPNDILRVLSVEVYSQLAVICNRALFSEARLPSEWLRSQLKLLPKPKTVGTEPGDYRPICLLSCAFKLLETVLLRRFRDFCNHYDRTHDRPFLSSVQGGFRHARGTLDQVVHLLLVQQNNMATNAAPGSDGRGVITVFLDIEKAFDSARHALVLQKLLYKGVPVHFVKMVSLLIGDHYCELDFTGANFERAALDHALEPNHQQKPRIDNDRGVIQGSIFGSTLWNVFIDDLIVELENAGVGCPLPRLPPEKKVECSSWFADDGGLMEHTCADMQRQLDICTRWAELNRIRFSPRKSVAMWLCKPSVLNAEYAQVGNEQLTLHNTQLSVVDSFCYLGIDIAGDGQLTTHCSQSKIDRATTRCEQLQAMLRSEHGLTPRLGLHVVRAKINSVLLYGCDILPPHPQADIVQRKVLRQVVSTYDRTHNWFLYSELGESRISTLAMVHFVSATARCVSSLTPVAPSLAVLTLEVVRSLTSANDAEVAALRSLFVPWQSRLEKCLKTLLFATTRDGVVSKRKVDLKTAIKLGAKAESSEQRTRRMVNEQLCEKRYSVVKTLTQLDGAEHFGLDVCKILALVCEKRLALGTRFASVDDPFQELRNYSKCVKALIKTYGLLYEHEWWCQEAASVNWPMTRVSGPGEGQPYLTEYSVQYANIAFLFRTGSFNPVDVVARNGGHEPRCRLCNEDGGDTPVHLLGICNGGANVKLRKKLESLRAQVRALFGDLELTDWKTVVYGLVGRTRGVSSRSLTRERVAEGCALLHEFYTLRRKAAKKRNVDA